MAFCFETKQFYYIVLFIILICMGFFSGKYIPCTKISKQLQAILNTTCIQCYDTFNNQHRKPCIVGPCQYTLCEPCVNKLFLQSNQAICPDCGIPIYKKNIMPNRLVMNILKIKQTTDMSLHDKTQPTADEIALLQREIVNKFMQVFNTQCHNCNNLFNSEDHQPIVLCPMQHVMCSECLKKKEKSLTTCGGCKKPVYPINQKHKSQLLKDINEFINKILFTQKLHLVVGDKVYKMILYTTVTIKDAFHTLQEAQLISRQLDIQECKFYVEQSQEYSILEKQIDFNSTIQEIIRNESQQVRVIMKYGKQALKKGQKVTMSSKVIKQLPIKIINFKQHSRFKQKQKQQSSIYPSLQISNQKYQFPSYQNYSKSIKLNLPQIKQRSSSSFSNLNKSTISRFQNQEELPKQKVHLIKYQSKKQAQIQKQRQKIMEVKKSGIQRLKEMPLGTQIDQKLLQNYSINKKNSINIQKQKVFDDFLKKHQIDPQNQQFICFKTQKIINKPFTKEEFNEHNLLSQQIDAKAKKGDILSQLLKILRSELHDGKIQVLFTAKSNKRSQMSLKIITSHFISDRFIIKQKILEDKTWFFEKIYESPNQLNKFLDYQKKRIALNFGMEQQNLVFHKLSKGPLVLQMSINQGASIANSIKNNLNMDIQLQPFFRQLQLCPEDFDIKGYISFPKAKKGIQKRGNWPYYQPINCVRFGIKVHGLFDNGSNSWLTMNNQPGEWAVGFHGVRNPNSNYKQYKNLIENIIHSSISKKFAKGIVIEEESLSYEFEKCENRPNQTIGKGIKLTPSLESALSQTQEISIDQKKYHLVFQCRLDPKKIKVRRKDNSQWIINESAAIRPYGIVIIQNSARVSYPTLQQQFGKNFIYKQLKQSIEKQ